jgi:DNA-binding GntR family transcriptional regulator
MARELERLSRTLERKRSIVEQVRHFLRDAIVSGKLRSGDRVVETRIARQLGVGQPTVRESLEGLREEGLIIRHPNRGCTVVELSPTQVSQIFRVRLEWEAMAVQLAMENWTAEKSQRLATALKALEAAARAGDARKYYEADLRFHQVLWQFADNPYLERALSQVTVPLFAFTMIQVVTRHSLDLIANYREHERVAVVIAAGDRKHALRIVREVLSSFRESALPLTQARPTGVERKRK